MGVSRGGPKNMALSLPWDWCSGRQSRTLSLSVSCCTSRVSPSSGKLMYTSWKREIPQACPGGPDLLGLDTHGSSEVPGFQCEAQPEPTTTSPNMSLGLQLANNL